MNLHPSRRSKSFNNVDQKHNSKLQNNKPLEDFKKNSSTGGFFTTDLKTNNEREHDKKSIQNKHPLIQKKNIKIENSSIPLITTNFNSKKEMPFVDIKNIKKRQLESISKPLRTKFDQSIVLLIKFRLNCLTRRIKKTKLIFIV